MSTGAESDGRDEIVTVPYPQRWTAYVPRFLQ